MNDLSALASEERLCLEHRIVEVTDPRELASHMQSWERLAELAAEPNVFYSPWALLPSARHLHAEQTLRVLLFFREDGDQQLEGLLPLFEKRCAGGISTLHSYRHRYCFSTEPLLCRGREMEVARSFVGWLHGRRFRCPLLSLRGLDDRGAWLRVLLPALEQQGVHYRRTEPVERALLRVEGGLEAFLERTPAKKRKEYRRLRERLEALGELRVEMLEAADDPKEWLDAFVALELKGWKGREGTALGSRPACRRFFDEVAQGAHARGQLMMVRMSLDGRPLAMLCDLLAPPGRYAFKTAYDEDYARYAPGVLLELENACHTFRAPRGVAWLDSCAAPDNALLNRLYPDRRSLTDLTICALGVARLGPWAVRATKRWRQQMRRRDPGSAAV